MQVLPNRNHFLICTLLTITLVAPLNTFAIESSNSTGPTSLNAIAKQNFTINFGDFESPAELTYPANTPDGNATVILIHGSTAADKDFTLLPPGGGPPLSHIFKDIAENFSAHGIAVLRYNKHYVTSATEVDAKKYEANADLNLFLSDAERVLASAKSNPHVDPRRIYVYGWSEGSTVAATLVARHPEIAGLIVQGPVALPWTEIFKYQMLGVSLPYVLSFSKDNRITADVLKEALAGDGGLVAKGDIFLFLVDPSYFQTQQLAISGILDANKDGALDPDTEIKPNIDRVVNFLVSPQGPLAIYGPSRALPTVAEQASNLMLPVLILQGQNDANVPAEGARKLDAAFSANPDRVLKIYPGLGHSLGLATSLIDDSFRPISPAPMADTVAWISAHARAVPGGDVVGMPTTGDATEGIRLLAIASLTSLVLLMTGGLSRIIAHRRSLRKRKIR